MRADAAALKWTHGAGMSSSERADDAGRLELERSARNRDVVIVHGRVVDVRSREYAQMCARRAAKVDAARLYREALDAQVRERDGRLSSAAESSATTRTRDGADATRARREREREEAARVRDEYVAALDRQVRERRERERRRIEEEARRERDVDERVRRAVEEERAQLEEKRAAMMRMASISGDVENAASARSPRILHSPPASPRWSPKAPPPTTTTTTSAAAAAARHAYQPIPEPSPTRRVTADSEDDAFGDVGDEDFGDIGQETTVEELIDVIRDLVVEQRALRRRCERAESALRELKG